MGWFKSHDGAPLDSKWVIVGRMAGVPPGVVAAVWWAALDHANQNHPRGSVKGFDVEAVAAFYGWEFEDCQRVMDALERRKLLIDGMVSQWDKRQSDSSAERTRRYRERQRDKSQQDENDTSHDTPETSPKTDETQHVTDVTSQVTDRQTDRKTEEKTLSGKPDRPDPGEPAKQVLAYLNSRVGREYREVDSNLKLIVARLREGATVDDCRRVIDARCGKWKADPKMAEYLRPATLFNATNFAQYVGELGGTGPPADAPWKSQIAELNGVEH